MPKYKITGPDGNGYVVTAPEGASQDDVLGYAKSHYQANKQTSLIGQLGSAASAYKASPQYATSPQGMLGNLNDMVYRGAGRLGEFTAELGGRAGVNPYVAAGAGTLTAMGPDIIMTAATPVGEPEEANKASISMGKRALGFQKGLLKTPFARSKAANAAKVALEEGIIPGSGSSDVAFARANELKGATGRQLGDIRESVGPQEIKPVFNQLKMLRNKLTEGGSRGGAWDVVHEKIDNAIRTLQGLYEGSSNKPIFQEPPIQGEQPPIPQGAPATGAPGPLRPALGPVPTKALPMRGQTLPSTDVAMDAPVRPQLGYWNKPPNFKGKPPTIIDAEIITDEAAEKAGKIVNRVGLNPVEAAKKRLAGGVNWLSDANAQKDAKSVSNAIEAGVEHILRKNGVPMDVYRSLKNKYGAASSMLEGLNNEIAGKEGRMMPSATGLLVGAGKVAGGDVSGALRDVGLWELLRRRGAGIGATSAYKAGETIPRTVTALRMLRRDKKKDENPNP